MLYADLAAATSGGGRSDTGFVTRPIDRLARCVDQLATAFRSGTVSEAEKVHQARVTLKRARAFWRAMKYSAPSNTPSEQLKFLRTASRRLALQREHDVMLETLAGFNQDISGSLLISCQLALSRHYEPLLAEDPASPGLNAALAALQTTVETAAHETQSLRPAKLFKRCRNASRRCRHTRERKAWHALRCRLKDFQYVLELAAEPLPEPLAPLHKTVKRLASQLGEANDLRILRKRVMALQPPVQNDCVKSIKRVCRKKTKQLLHEAATAADDCLDARYKHWKNVVRDLEKSLCTQNA